MKQSPWIGILGGAIAWYSAHELGFYFSDFNCHHRAILPIVHVVALAAALWCTWLSFRAIHDQPTSSKRFIAMVGVAAGALFSYVVFQQLIATLIYSGCER